MHLFELLKKWEKNESIVEQNRLTIIGEINVSFSSVILKKKKG
jgi:hypothetical protein